MKFLLLLILSFPLLAFADSYESVREDFFYYGPSTKLEQRIINLVKSDKKDLDNLLFLSNYFSWTDQRKKEISSGYTGFKRSPKDSDYKMLFWNHVHRNQFLLAGSYLSGTKYNATSFLVQSSHNYDNTSKDWLMFNVNLESRWYHPGIYLSDLAFGIGWLHFFRSNLYLQSFFNFSPSGGFMPTWVIDEELFLSKDDDTFSLGLRYSYYNENSNTLLLSPHWRHDFSNWYLGGRINLMIANPDALLYYKIYIGHSISLRWNHEASLSIGDSKEDGVRVVNFWSIDYGLKYKWSYDKEIGLKYNYYDSSYMRNHTTFLNFLYKY